MYYSINITPYISVSMTKKTKFNFAVSYLFKKYTGEHWIQNAFGNYLTGQRHYHSAIMTKLSFDLKPHEFFSISPQYIFKYLFSNNKFTGGQYSYNYNVHYFGLNLSFEY